MSCLKLALLWVLLAPAYTKFVLQPKTFLKLPARNDVRALNSGAADKAAYDYQEHFLYVIGYKADVLHVINMTNPNEPTLLATKEFMMANMGLPDTVQVCRGGINREFLSITFESKDQQERSHVHFFQLLDASNYDELLTNLKTPVTLEGFDPKGSAWKTDCTQLLVVSKGEAHEVNGAFVDPSPTTDILIPSFGTTVDKTEVSIIEDRLEPAGVRYVFQQCDTGSYTNTSSRKQDLQATTVTVDKNNMAYIVFQDNNAIGTLDLTNQFPSIDFYSLGMKDWGIIPFDGSYDDAGTVLKTRKHVRSFYQPGDLVSFELDGKVWLATADTGSIRSVSESTCTFEESVDAANWNQSFGMGITGTDRIQLEADMNDVAEIGRLKVSKLRQPSDGWDPLFLGYDFVCSYGGRGFSILDPVDMTRVYDSGDDFERYFNTSEATEPQRAVYNANRGDDNMAQSSEMDKASPLTGPTPSAITVADINSTTQVLIIANGRVGGLYTYLVRSGPAVEYQSFIRRGQAGLAWSESYDMDGDAVGEPSISDLIYFDDQGQKTLVAVSSFAGVISVYQLEDLP